MGQFDIARVLAEGVEGEQISFNQVGVDTILQTIEPIVTEVKNLNSCTSIFGT